MKYIKGHSCRKVDKEDDFMNTLLLQFPIQKNAYMARNSFDPPPWLPNSPCFQSKFPSKKGGTLTT